MYIQPVSLGPIIRMHSAPGVRGEIALDKSSQLLVTVNAESRYTVPGINDDLKKKLLVSYVYLG
jgi:hypothetical protein